MMQSQLHTVCPVNVSGPTIERGGLLGRLSGHWIKPVDAVFYFIFSRSYD